MKANLSSNKELDNYKEQDTFNFITKADAIKSFLEFSLESLRDNKMIVLYGDWGSGKSSLMKHIEKEINEAIYYPIFFKAWEHEKDDNLPLSLCDTITNSIKQNKKFIEGFKKYSGPALKCFASGITIKTPIKHWGLGFDVEVSGEKIVKEIDEKFKVHAPTSSFQSLNDFKKKFKELEEKLLSEKKAKKLLIFIDDLDRCEPENVLNLITAIKLFFTYGEQSVYFCGLDKKAVKMAVKTKYKNVVKSEEYLEKVFDITFNMPKTYDIKKILKQHFKDFNSEFIYKDDNGTEKSSTINSITLIDEFFNAINIRNPRHLKKILNKYEIIKKYKTSQSMNDDIKKLIPQIIFLNENGKLFETIYCLYMILLYEFQADKFLEIENYDYKMVHYLKVAKEIRSPIAEFNAQLFLENHKEATFQNMQVLNNGNKYGYSKFLFLFSNNDPQSIGLMMNHELDKFIQYFPDDTVPTNFCKFLIKYMREIDEESKDSDYVIWNLFNMANYLL